MSDHSFKINRSITEDDIPKQRHYKESKYEPIAKSCKTLEVDEGIEVDIDSPSQYQGIVKLLKKRMPRRHFHVTTRNLSHGHKVYIIRKS